MNQSKRGAGYTRCSTSAQAESSPTQQRMLILERALKDGYDIVEWFNDDGKSGTNFEKRPGFRRLLDRINSKPDFERLYVLDESRWGRAGAQDSIYYKRHFKKVANVDVVIIRTIANTGNEMFDTMLGAFEGGLSREESLKKSVRTKDGCVAAVRQGHSAGGTAPYGYERYGVNRFTGAKRKLGIVSDQNERPVLNSKGLPISEQIKPKEEYTIWELGDAKEVDVVKRIFDLRIRFGYGYTKIAKILNNEGIPCPKRGKWANKNQRWSQGTIGSIIRNPVYMGARAYDRLKKNGIGKFAPRYFETDRKQWVIVENILPSIVTKEQWEAANPSKANSSNGRLARKRFDSPYLLSSLIKCSQCGLNFSGKKQTVGRRGHRGSRRTYVDSGYLKGSMVCSSFNIGADNLEDKIVAIVKDRISSSAMNGRLKEMLIADFNMQSHSSIEESEKEINKQISFKTNEINSLIELVSKVPDVQEIADRIHNAKREREELESRRGETQKRERGAVNLEFLLGKISDFVRTFEERFNKAPLCEKKAFVQKMVDQIVIDRERRVARCFVLNLPKGEDRKVDEIIERERTHLLAVPPTRFELVFQA